MHELGTSRRPDLPLAVVVGAGGLGMAVSRRLAVGHRILLADINGHAAEAGAARMRGEGCDATAFACDATDPQAVSRLAIAVEQHGGFGSVVYVAGLSPSAADFHAIMRVNLMGAALVCDALLPQARQGSAAVLVSSMAARMYQPAPEVIEIIGEVSAPDMPARLGEALGESANSGLAYTLSKWGMYPYCRRRAACWGEKGARIVSISPGFIATPMGALEFEKNPHKLALYERSPATRECTMLEIADVVEFLASPRAAYINGTDLLVDGGVCGALGFA